MIDTKLHPEAANILKRFVIHLWAFESDVYTLQQEHPGKFIYPIWDSENNCEYTADRTPNQEVGDIYNEVITLTDQLLKLLGFDSIESFEKSIRKEISA